MSSGSSRIFVVLFFRTKETILERVLERDVEKTEGNTVAKTRYLRGENRDDIRACRPEVTREVVLVVNLNRAVS